MLGTCSEAFSGGPYCKHSQMGASSFTLLVEGKHCKDCVAIPNLINFVNQYKVIDFLFLKSMNMDFDGSIFMLNSRRE